MVVAYMLKLAPSNGNALIAKAMPFMSVMFKEAMEEMREFPPEVIELYIGQLVGLVQYIADGVEENLPEDFKS